MMESKIIKGTVLALSSIVHNQILSINTTNVKGEAKALRTMPFILNDGETSLLKQIPVVSGNSIRGIGRRMLVDFSFDVLNIDLEEIFSKVDDQKRIAFFFRNGGLTPKGTKLCNASVGTYERISKIPFLGLLGGVYMGHHFGGAMCVGTLTPIIKEMVGILNGIELSNNIPGLNEISDINNEIRYTRCASGNDNENDDKEAMIYATKVIPAGIQFYSYNTCYSSEEGVLLAFPAFFALISNHGYIGGMSGRGHGHCSFNYSFDRAAALKRYQEYLLTHKEEIVETIKIIPEVLTAVVKKDEINDKDLFKRKEKK